ncbi:MAG: sensor histidine kinase [Gemmatimonadaceae bacterium]
MVEQSSERELKLSAARDRRPGHEEMRALLEALRGRQDHLERTLAARTQALAALAAENSRLHGAALQAGDAKTSFLTVMSHELRTPLTSMLGYAELLADGITGPVTPAQVEQLKRIAASGRHLLSLIEEILTFSRLQAGSETVAVEGVNLARVAHQAAVVAEPVAKGKGLRFSVRVPVEPVEIETDATKVRQILINLLMNAINFTPAGDVELELAVEGDRVRASVRDTGVGIARDHTDRVFEPFWQAEQCETRRVGGAGLGLSVARRLARLLGGDVSVVSVPNRGSCFTVRLPRTRTATATPVA